MGLFGKLFGRKRAPVNVNTLDLSGLLRLVSDYGSVIEAQTRTGSVVHDESKLPAPKDDMRKALITLIASVNDAEQRGQLKAGYLMLAEFQPGVGSRVIKIDPLDLTSGMQRGAAKVAEQAAEFERWSQRSLVDTLQLQQDLAALGGARK